MKTRILLLLILVMSLFYSGCSPGDRAIQKAEEAVTAQDYDQALRFARQARLSSYKQEANIIIHYIKYKDNMLHAAFWEQDV